MNFIPLLLSNPSVNLRLLVLKELIGKKNDGEINELELIKEDDKFVSELVNLQNADGSWNTINPMYTSASNKIMSTSIALTRLGYFGFDKNYLPLKKGVEFLFSIQKKDGSWALQKENEESGSKYSMVPLQTSLPLQGIALCGYSQNPSSEKAYEWLLKQKLEDGAWPTGIASGVFGYVAGYRKISHSRWGCRSNTTSVLICLSRHPELKKSPEARKALDLLLGRNTKESYCLGYEIARMLGLEQLKGFFTFYARHDIGLMLDLCSKIGIAADDERVNSLIDFIINLKGKYGFWEYKSHNQASFWITFDILRSLSGLKTEYDWFSKEPVTPFKTYFKKTKRY